MIFIFNMLKSVRKVLITDNSFSLYKNNQHYLANMSGDTVGYSGESYFPLGMCGKLSGHSGKNNLRIKFLTSSSELKSMSPLLLSPFLFQLHLIFFFVLKEANQAKQTGGESTNILLYRRHWDGLSLALVVS